MQGSDSFCLTNPFFKKGLNSYDYSISNTVEIFRMYDKEKNNWIVFKYFYLKNSKQITTIDKIEFPKENMGKL